MSRSCSNSSVKLDMCPDEESEISRAAEAQASASDIVLDASTKTFAISQQPTAQPPPQKASSRRRSRNVDQLLVHDLLERRRWPTFTRQANGLALGKRSRRCCTNSQGLNRDLLLGELCLSRWGGRRVRPTRTPTTKDCRHEGAAKTAVSRRLADPPFSRGRRLVQTAQRRSADGETCQRSAAARSPTSGRYSKEQRGLRLCQVDHCARQREDKISGQPPSCPPPRAIGFAMSRALSWPSAHVLQGGGEGGKKGGTPATQRQEVKSTATPGSDDDVKCLLAATV